MQKVITLALNHSSLNTSEKTQEIHHDELNKLLSEGYKVIQTISCISPTGQYAGVSTITFILELDS